MSLNIGNYTADYQLALAMSLSLQEDVKKKSNQAAVPALSSDLAKDSLSSSSTSIDKSKAVEKMKAALLQTINLENSEKQEMTIASQKEVVIDLTADDQPSSSSSSSSAGIKLGSGIPNIGNSCYMNAALQALASWPSLTKRLQADDDASLEVKAFRKQVLVFVEKLQKNEMIFSEDAHWLLDFFIEQGWSSKREKTQQKSIDLFFDFLFEKLQFSSKNSSYEVGSGLLPTALQELFLPTKNVSSSDARRIKKLSIAENKSCDLLQFSLGRFDLHGMKKSKTRIVPSLSLELPYQESTEKKERYILAAVTVNPSSSLESGHYITYTLQQVGKEQRWVEYNDSSVTSYSHDDAQILEIIEQHSIHYLYTHSIS